MTSENTGAIMKTKTKKTTLAVWSRRSRGTFSGAHCISEVQTSNNANNATNNSNPTSSIENMPKS